MTKVKEAYVPINGIKMYYREAGEGFPLMGIMGLGANSDWWSPDIVRELSADYRFVMPDNRGAGRTECPEENWTIENNADDTIALMDTLGIDKAHLLGVSMGGSIAQAIAINYPDRVEKLVLNCTLCGFTNGVTPCDETMNMLGAFATGDLSLEETARKTTELLYSQHTFETKPELVEAFVQIYCLAPISQEGLMKQMTAGLRFDSLDRLKYIKAPTLILAGMDDILIPPENSDILYQNIPDARLMKFAPAAHGFLAEVPEFVAIVKDFLLR
jgi:pimeloyl-ACP methyl ester carboxylesterase